jgi:MbtH protein
MATSDLEEDTRTYIVLVNQEEQYSLWLADKTIPPGWTAVGPQGSQQECSEYVDRVWTDLRPLSLRKKMMG